MKNYQKVTSIKKDSITKCDVLFICVTLLLSTLLIGNYFLCNTVI